MSWKANPHILWKLTALGLTKNVNFCIVDNMLFKVHTGKYFQYGILWFCYCIVRSIFFKWKRSTESETKLGNLKKWLTQWSHSYLIKVADHRNVRSKAKLVSQVSEKNEIYYKFRVIIYCVFPENVHNEESWHTNTDHQDLSTLGPNLKKRSSWYYSFLVSFFALRRKYTFNYLSSKLNLWIFLQGCQAKRILKKLFTLYQKKRFSFAWQGQDQNQ